MCLSMWTITSTWATHHLVFFLLPCLLQPCLSQCHARKQPADPSYPTNSDGNTTESRPILDWDAFLHERWPSSPSNSCGGAEKLSKKKRRRVKWLFFLLLALAPSSPFPNTMGSAALPEAMCGASFFLAFLLS
ncbi:hypothetical protein BC940DRAFT_18309 [Gongronella butleri]|nr:hypothetical protein BC940DRAFT_18309 [Gongronella butleri]